MYIPTDILSTLTTRTDSGSGVKQSPGSGVENNASRFERMFEKEIAKYESREPEYNTYTEEGKEVNPVIETINDEDPDKTGETLAAGVMGNLQTEVVFILEGDSNSITTLEMRVETPDTNPVINPDIEINPETTAQAGEVNTETTKPVTAHAEVSGEVNTNTAEDVMARMPEIRTQDRQDNAESNSKSSENGNLSPLENENDKTQVKGQTEKTYSQTVETVQDKVATEQEVQTNEVIAPPLSEGIKPEQFKAAQQMTEATLNTPVKTENLFQAMVDRVEMMQTDTKSAMTIQLNPEFLGKVALEVAVDAAGLHVKINAEDSGVRSMINGQLTTLIESLENKGIAVVEVEVVYTGINYGTFQDPREGQQQENKQQYTAKREVSSTDGVAYYTALPDLLDYYLETGVSSVEYSA